MLILSFFRATPLRTVSPKAALARFLKSCDGAVTSSFVVLSSAALTVTTATVVSVSGGVEMRSAEIADELVQIAPGELLDLDQPPYNIPADADANEGPGGIPTIIENEAVAPESSRPGGFNATALIDGDAVGGGSGSGGSGGGAGGSSGGGGFGGGMNVGINNAPDLDSEDEDNLVGSRS